MILVPISALLAAVVFTAIERSNFRAYRLPIQSYLTQANLLLATLGLIAYLIAGDQLPALFQFEATATIWPWLALFLGIEAVRNLIYYRGYRAVPLNRSQLVTLTEPLAIFVLAAALFPDERNPIIWIGAGIALVAQVLAHRHQGGFSVRHGERWLLLHVALTAIQAVLAKELLGSIGPVLFLTIRTGITGLLYAISFGWSAVRFGSLTRRILTPTLVIFVHFCLLYASYQLVGLTLTSLVLLAKPALVLFVAHWRFRERITVRTLAASAVTVTTIAAIILTLPL